MDPISNIGGVVGFAAFILKTSEKIYEFIKSVKDTPAEFQRLAQELEIISGILTSWTEQTKRPPNPHITSAIQACQLHLAEVNELATKYQLRVGFGRRERMMRGLKGTLAKTKVQELQIKLESTKSTLQTAIAMSLHSDVQLMYQELLTLKSDSTCLPSTHLTALFLERHHQPYISNVGAIDRAVDSISRKMEQDSRVISDIVCNTERSSSSGKSKSANQTPGSSVADLQLRKRVNKLVRDQFEYHVEEECRQRTLLARHEEDERQRYLGASDISHKMRPGRSYLGPAETKASNSGRDKRMRPHSARSAPLHIATPANRIKTRCIRRHDAFLGTLIFRCDIQVTSYGETVSHEIKISFTLIPKPQFSSIVSLFRMSLAQNRWNRLPIFDLKHFNVVSNDSAIFKLIEGNGSSTEIRDLLACRAASPSDVDTVGYTPLHHAVYCNRFDLCQILIDNGAIADADLGSGSPLNSFFWNKSGRNAKIMRLLLANGADPWQMESNGKASFAHAIDSFNKEELRILMPYRGLNDMVSMSELESLAEHDRDFQMPWCNFLITFGPLASAAHVPLSGLLDHFDLLHDLGARHLRPASHFAPSLHQALFLMMNDEEIALSREDQVAVLKKSIDICSSTHDLWTLKNAGAYNPWHHTTTAVAIETGRFDVWKEALLDTGENIDKFLEDDFKILQTHNFHLRNCTTESCRDGGDTPSKRAGLTCWDWYFGGLVYKPDGKFARRYERSKVRQRFDIRRRCQDEGTQEWIYDISKDEIPEDDESESLEWKQDLLGGALRSQLGEFVPEIDSERYIVYLFAALFLQAILVISKLVNPAPPRPELISSLAAMQDFNEEFERDNRKRRLLRSAARLVMKSKATLVRRKVAKMGSSSGC